MQSLEEHFNENMLRAYLDGELAPDSAAELESHLETCPKCRERLGEIRLLITRSAALLAVDEAGENPALALSRLKPLISAPVPRNYKPAASAKKVFIFNPFPALKRRPLLALLAALVLSLGLLALPPVSSAAEQLLSVFRAQKSVFVPVDNQRLQDLVKAGMQVPDLFGKQTFKLDNLPIPQKINSLEDAAPITGFTPAKPSAFPEAVTGSEFTVYKRVSGQIQLNVTSLRQLLALLKITDVNIPDELGSNPVKVEIPPFSGQRYKGEDFQVDLYQSLSPGVNLPGNVSMAHLSQVALRLLGMNPQQAQELSKQVDLRSALILPFPVQINRFKQVTINGEQALLLDAGDETGNTWLLYWQKDERFYVMLAQGKIREFEVIALANSVR